MSRRDGLLDGVGPRVYRRNAFRVTGLATDARPRELRRRLRELELAARLSEAPAGKGPLPLVPAPSVDEIRVAAERLEEPRSRIVEELFWFRPLGEDDPALRDLAASALGEALARWQSAGADGHHNLAVAHHASALDLELGVAEPTAEFSRRRDRHWVAAYRYWRAALGGEPLWMHLARRAEALDDPRVDATVPQHLRAELPGALLRIQGALAAEAAEAGRRLEARRHAATMRTRSGFPDASVDAALEVCARPLASRVRSLVDELGRQVEEQPRKGKRAAEEMARTANPLLVALMQLLPENSTLLTELRNVVAEALHRCAVEYAEATEKWNEVRQVLRGALKLAVARGLREAIRENLKSAKAIQEVAQCFFCEKGKRDERHDIVVALHGIVGCTGDTIHYRSLEVRVPRCVRCARLHAPGEWFVGVDDLGCVPMGVGCAGGLGVLAIAWIHRPGNWFPLYLAGGGLVWLGGMLLGTWASKFVAPRNARPHTDAVDHPAVKSKLHLGWSLGKSP